MKFTHMYSDIEFTTLARNIMNYLGLHKWELRMEELEEDSLGRPLLGICDHDKYYIAFSPSRMRNMNEIGHREVILHEVAHALAGHEAGHGKGWRQIARKIGSQGTDTFNDARYQASKFDWVGECPVGHRVGSRKQPQGWNWSCTKCAPGWSPEHMYTWKYAGALWFTPEDGRVAP